MFDRIRQRLDRIRYYSATRPRTAWTRAVDVAGIATLVAAIPATLAIDLSTRSPVVTQVLTGSVVSHADGTLTAHTAEESMDLRWAELDPHAQFTFSLSEIRHGWPITTSLERPATRLDLDLYSSLRKDARLAPDDPIRVALADLLRRKGETAVLDRWASSSVERHFKWTTIVATSIVTWVMLYVFTFILIQLLRAVSAVRSRRRMERDYERRVSGQCAACGYDMKGLEFIARCPECGAMVV